MNSLCDIKVGSRLYREQSYRDVLAMLSSGDLPFFAKASECWKNKWGPLLQFSDFDQFLVGKMMLAANGYSYESLFNHWYIKDGQRSFGPFSMLQMLEFFQQRRLHLDNLVRHPLGRSWEPFASCGPFGGKNLELLLASPAIQGIVGRRQQPRIKYDHEVFLSVSAELYRGVTWSLSRRGLGLVTDRSTDIDLDHRVNIIINSNNDHGSVQVKGRVVHIHKEVNYERVAVEFDEENEFLNQYIDQRIPNL